jgi:hypothetical protein
MGIYKKPNNDGYVKQKGPAYGGFAKEVQKDAKRDYRQIRDQDFYDQFYRGYGQQQQAGAREIRQAGAQGLGSHNQSGLVPAAISSMYSNSAYPQLRLKAEQYQRDLANQAANVWRGGRQAALDWWATRQGIGLQSESIAQTAAMQGASAGGGGWLSSIIGMIDSI